jgi:hypothetical protein
MGIARRLLGESDSTQAFPFVFQITTTSANTVFTCPITDYGGLTPQLTINWGDSSVSPLITSSSSVNRIHTYVSAGTYTITITGLMPGFQVNNNVGIRSLITSIIQFGTVGLRTLNFYGCINITSIPSSASLSAVGGYDGLNEIISFSNFMNGTSITSIPADMFDFSPNVTSFASAFATINTISTVPSGLFDTSVNVVSFASCFFACASLTSVPSTLFDLNINVTSFSGTFRNCRALTNILQFTFNTAVTTFSQVYNMSSTSNALSGTAPELWNRVPTPAGTDAFRNCTGLTNFASIPPTFT